MEERVVAEENTPCPNPNCIPGRSHPWCFNCYPNYEEPKLCNKCGNPSKGGRLVGSRDPICQRCFYQLRESSEIKPGYYFTYEHGNYLPGHEHLHQ